MRDLTKSQFIVINNTFQYRDHFTEYLDSMMEPVHVMRYIPRNIIISYCFHTVTIMASFQLATAQDDSAFINNCFVTTDMKMDCSKLNLSSISAPLHQIYNDTTSLDLSHKEIFIIGNGTFRLFEQLISLDLSHNKITNIEMDCFSGLHHLKILDISHNKLTIPSSFHPGVFKPLQTLEILKMEGTTNGGQYPDEALRDLITLRELYMSGINKPLGYGFTQLINLELLHLGSPKCSIGVIQNNTLANLRFSKLKHLTFHQCSIERMDNHSLEHFTSLNTLNAACNYKLVMRNVLQAISNIPGKPVETLVLDGIDKSLDDFNYDTVCFTNFPNLKRLSIRNNDINSVSMDVLNCTPSLEVINIGFNALTSTWAPWHIFHNDTRKYWENSSLTEIDMSYGFNTLQTTFKPLYCPDYTISTEKYFRNFKIPSVNAIEEFTHIADRTTSIVDQFLRINFNSKLQAVHVDHVHFFFSDHLIDFATARGYFSSPLCKFSLPKNDIRFVNASYNAFSNFNCHVAGLDHLLVLDLSHSGLKSLHTGTLKSAPNLRTLLLSGNELGPNFFDWETAMGFVPKLEMLSISGNKIKQLPRQTFSKATALREIDISQNSLSELNIELKPLLSLETVDLSANLITSLKQPFLNELIKRDSLNATLTINLVRNPFQCDCDSIDFLKFIKSVTTYSVVFKHLQEYNCLYFDEQVPMVNVDILALKDSCKENNYYTIIIAVLVTIIVLLIIVAVITYRCRWKIAWKVYEVRRIVRQAKRRKSFRLPVHKYV